MRVGILLGLSALLPPGAWAQARPAVADVLRNVSRNYKAVTRYEFTVDATSTEIGSHDTYHMEFAFKAPNMYRMVGSLPAFSIPDPNFAQATLVYDGSDVWFYLPKVNRYGSFSSSALTAGNSGDLGDLKPEAMDRFVMGRFRRAADFAGGAQLLREESIEIAHAKVNCLVVMVLTRDSESPYTWWIDKTRYRILREDHEGTRSLYTSIRLDEPIRDEVFKFEPPPGAEKLATQ